MRVCILLTILLCPIACVVGWAQDATDTASVERVLVEDFEQGIGHWFTNDDEVAGTGASSKCAIYAMSGGAPEGGEQSARIEFIRGGGWASVTLPVDGRDWASKGCSKLALWIRGDGSSEPLRIVLRVQTRRPHRDVAYSQVIRVDGTDWERFSFRSFGFRDSDGNILQLDDIQHIKLLQFAKNGGWGTFRFRVDEIAAEVEPGGPRVPMPDAGAPGKTLELAPDFAKPAVPALMQLGMNLGEPPTILESGDAQAESWALAVASDLGPCAVRVALDDYFDSESEAYDLQALQGHVDWIRACGNRPLICLDVPRTPVDDPERKARLYGLFLQAVARVAAPDANGGKGCYYEVFDEPMVSGAFNDIRHVIGAYNKIADLIVRTDETARVGGPGFASPWADRVEAFLKSATRLDFLSFHFYGTHNPLTQSQTLFEAAYKTRCDELPHQLSFQQVKHLAKTLRTRTPEIYITELALTSARSEDGSCRDERPTTAFGAAWLAATVLSGSPYIDKVMFYKLAGGGWGLISGAGLPTTTYWSAWLLAHYMPRGSLRQQVFRLDDFTIAATVKTRTAHNLVIAYAGLDPLELCVSPEGLPALGQVRERHVGADSDGWQGAVLPCKPYQEILLDGPGVFVLQYIPKQ